MMAINRYRLSNLIRTGSKSAKLTSRLLAQVDKLLGSILFGNTLLNVAAAAVTNIVIMRLFGADELTLLLGTLAITFILLVFSEIMPKILAASYPERIASTRGITMGRPSHCPMLMPNDSKPRKPSGSRLNSAIKRKLP